MFKCLGWPCPATFIFCFSRHQSHVTLWSSCALKHVMWQRVFLGASYSSSKYETWYSEQVIFQFKYVGSLAGVTYLRYTVRTSFSKSETAVHCCDPAVNGSCHVGVSKRFSRSISLAVYCSWLPNFQGCVLICWERISGWYLAWIGLRPTLKKSPTVSLNSTEWAILGLHNIKGHHR